MKIEINAADGSHVQVTDQPIVNNWVLGDMVQYKTVSLGESKAAAPEAATVVEESKAAAPEAATVAEESRTAAPEVVTVVEESKTAAPEAATVVEENKAAAPEVVTVAEESRTAVPEVVTVAEESRAAVPEAATVAEESKTAAPEAATVVEESKAAAAQGRRASEKAATMVEAEEAEWKDPLLSEVLPVFKGCEEVAAKFLKLCRDTKAAAERNHSKRYGKAITDEVNRLIKAGLAYRELCMGAKLGRTLVQAGLYDYSESNWNARIK